MLLSTPRGIWSTPVHHTAVQSSGYERMLEHNAHFSSFSIDQTGIDRLLALAKGGLGSLWRTGGGAIFSRGGISELGVMPA